MLTVEQALQQISEHTWPLAPVRARLRDAVGHVLAQDVQSDIDSPPHNKAMMDGYAVVATDRATERKIIEEVMAGDVPRRAVTPGTTTRIMTGAPVPEGATAVVPIEKTKMTEDGMVHFDWVDPPVGKHIMRQGSSLRVGQQVLTAGTHMRPIEVAVLAEVGCAAVQVFPRPQVAVLATGNELVTVEQRPTAGHIRNSNGPMLTTAVKAAGATADELPVGRDDLDELKRLVHQGLNADVLLVTGGVSAGAKDLVPAALEESGVEQVFHKIALKPGKPLWFGIVPRIPGPPKLVFGLPGNPVSGFVCFELFVKPVLARLAGRGSNFALPLRQGVIASRYDHHGGRETFRPAYFRSSSDQSRFEVMPLEWHGSADLAGLANANCLLHLPPRSLLLNAGDAVDFLPLSAADDPAMSRGS